MPLDARKVQHLLQVVTRSFASRQRTIIVVYLAGGSYSFIALPVIMRSQQVIDPQMLDAAGQALPRNADTVIIAPLGTNFTGAVFVADTATATAAAVAPQNTKSSKFCPSALCPVAVTCASPCGGCASFSTLK